MALWRPRKTQPSALGQESNPSRSLRPSHPHFGRRRRGGLGALWLPILAFLAGVIGRQIVDPVPLPPIHAPNPIAWVEGLGDTFSRDTFTQDSFGQNNTATPPADLSTTSSALPSTDNDPVLTPANVPMMVELATYRETQDVIGNAMVYGVAHRDDIPGQIQQLAAIQNPNVTKMMMVNSIATLQTLINNYDAQLKAAGITTIGYNTEREPVNTPETEMRGMFATGNANTVAQLVNVANPAGYDVIWGAIRLNMDNVSDEAISAILAAGLKGIALQEQNPISSGNVAGRVDAVTQTVHRYRQIAQQVGRDPNDLHVTVQIMATTPELRARGQTRCPNPQTCSQFVAELLRAQLVDTIALWRTPSKIEPNTMAHLITTIRHQHP